MGEAPSPHRFVEGRSWEEVLEIGEGDTGRDRSWGMDTPGRGVKIGEWILLGPGKGCEG